MKYYHSIHFDNIDKNKNMFQCSVIHYSIGKTLVIQSEEFKEGKPLFLLNIQEDLSFFGYHCGVKSTISTLSTNRIMSPRFKWSRVTEAIRFLNTKVIGRKVEILLEQVWEKRNILQRQSHDHLNVSRQKAVCYALTFFQNLGKIEQT